MLIKLAALNLLRNKRRNILLVTFIAVSISSLCLFLGYIEFTKRGIRIESITETGHLVIAKKSYWNAVAGASSEQEMSADMLNTLIGKFSDVPVTTEKVLDFSGLIGTEERSTIFSGVAYENESSILSLPLEEGEAIFDGDSDSIMTGRTLANILHAKIGDSLQVTSNSEYGFVLYSQDLVGTLAFPSIEAEKFAVVTNISNAWNMFGNYGNANKLQLRIKESLDLQSKNEEEEEQTMKQVQMIIQDDYPDLEIKDWKELSPIYKGVLSLYSSIFGFLLANFMVFVFISILQTVINISLERMREFGTLRALGITRVKLGVLVLQEMLIITLVGIILSIGFTAAAVYILRVLGFEFTPPSSTRSISTDFVFEIHNIVLVVIIPIVSIVILSCLYPIIKIARLQVTKVLEG